MRVYVCVVYMWVCVCVYMWMCACVYVYMCICECVCVARICECVYMCICECLCVWWYMWVCVLYCTVWEYNGYFLRPSNVWARWWCVKDVAHTPYTPWVRFPAMCHIIGWYRGYTLSIERGPRLTSYRPTMDHTYRLSAPQCMPHRKKVSLVRMTIQFKNYRH